MFVYKRQSTENIMQCSFLKTHLQHKKCIYSMKTILLACILKSN